MPRRSRKDLRRTIIADPKFKDVEVSKFISCVMCDGKKYIAEKIVYKALHEAEIKLKVPAIEIFKAAVANVMPAMEVQSRRIGGATYQVPVEVRYDRALALAMRWLIHSAKKRVEKTMWSSLAGEFVDSFSGKGASVKKKEETHKMAEANRAFAHYRLS